MSEPSLPDKVIAVDRALTGARVGHAFGGALALAYYAEPRTTIDIDVNVFASPGEHGTIQAALAALGVGGEADPAAVERDGQCRWWWGRTPLDVFFAYDELHDAMRRAARRVPFGEDELTILAPEHLVVCKVVFDRPKDWLDVEQVLVCVGDLDAREILGWLERIAGADDPRHQHFLALASMA